MMLESYAILSMHTFTILANTTLWADTTVPLQHNAAAAGQLQLQHSAFKTQLQFNSHACNVANNSSQVKEISFQTSTSQELTKIKTMDIAIASQHGQLFQDFCPVPSQENFWFYYGIMFFVLSNKTKNIYSIAEPKMFVLGWQLQDKNFCNNGLVLAMQYNEL